jgi:hypothetical protein
MFVLSATPYMPAAAERAIAAEAGQHGDVLRVSTGGMPDSWQVLPAKVLAAVRWAASAEAPGAGAALVLKTDHDCWADLPGIAQAAAAALPPGADVYWGSFYVGSLPKQDAADRYYDAVWNSSAPYPPYASGPGYVLSPSLASAVAARWGPGRPPVSVLEDVTVGHAVGVVSPAALRLHDPWRLVTQRIPVCIRGMLLKHCSKQLAAIPRYHANVRLRGDPCSADSSHVFVPDPL